jgi:ribosomal protein S12 methylthiotransferase accessory factor
MPISTGLAAGPTVEHCIEKGICEILERDALMLCWYSKIITPRIAVDSCRGISPEIDALLDAGASDTQQWHIGLLTLDVEIPVVYAALIDFEGQPKTSFGISAATNIDKAILLALEEAVLTRILVNRSKELKKANSDDAGTVKTLRDHLLIHAASMDMRKRAAFMLDDGPQLALADIKNRFQRSEQIPLIAKLHRIGLIAYWKDLTTRDVSDCGIRVARVIIPGAQPLDNDHRYRYLNGKRLVAVAQQYGSTVAHTDQLNPDPHPFP